jgi:hypothetical protein
MWHAWGGDRCLQGFGWEAGIKRPLEKPRRMWEDKIKLELRETEVDVNEPSGSKKKAEYFLTS